MRKLLRESGIELYAVQMQAYMKSEMPYHGVKSPGQKQIFRKAIKQHKITAYAEYIQVIEQLWDAEYREERYLAISVARTYGGYQTIEALTTFEMMIRTGEWWDYIDVIAAHLIGSLLSKYSENMRAILKRWISDENIWIRRSAILSQLRFKESTDAVMLFDFCNSCLHEKSFWIRKAIGWALREYSKTNPDSVRQFIDSNRELMSNLTRREGSKYV